MKKRLLLLILSSLVSLSALAFEPFQVKDIRVEGIQRTEAGNGIQLPAGQGRRHRRSGARDRRRQGALCHRIFQGRPAGTGRQRAGGSGRGAAGHRADRHRRIQGIRRQAAQGRAETDRTCRVADFRPRAAGPRRAGTEEPVHQPRQVRRQHHHHRDPAGTQPGGDQFRHLRRPGGENPPDQHRRQQRVQGQGPARRIRPAHARIAHLVQQERPVLEAQAAGRPRGAAHLLPQPGLSRVHHRFDPGIDHARQARHLHHRQYHGRQEVYRHRREARRRTDRAGSGTAQADQAEEGRCIFAGAADRDDQADQRPSRQRGLCLCQHQPGAGDRPREERSGIHALYRPRPARVRAAHRHQRQHQHAGRGDPPRNAATGKRLVLHREAQPLQAAHRQARILSPTCRSIRRACPELPTRSTWKSRSTSAPPAILLSESAIRRRRASFCRRRVAEQYLRQRQRAVVSGEHRQRQQGLLAVLHQPVLLPTTA